MIKVLHVRGGECVEASLIGSYEKAGVDVFLFDVVTDDGRVGSTGQALDPAVVAPLAGQADPAVPARRRNLGRQPRASTRRSRAHPLFLGIDVDTNARGADGKISARSSVGGDQPEPGRASSADA